jgi:hypothetical protein
VNGQVGIKAVWPAAEGVRCSYTMEESKRRVTGCVCNAGERLETAIACREARTK